MTDTTGGRIRQRREALGFSVWKLTTQIGFSHPMILDYERGKTLPRGVQAVVLARALGVTVEWLLAPAVNEWLDANGFDPWSEQAAT